MTRAPNARRRVCASITKGVFVIEDVCLRRAGVRTHDRWWNEEDLTPDPRYLNARGERVLEVERPSREGPKGRLKTDALDAERAARQLLAGTAGALPRLAPDTQALRALLSTREGAVSACTAAINELRALIVVSPHELRERLQGRSEAALLDACVRLRPGNRDTERAAVALALRSLALRVRQLRNEAKTLEKELARRVKTLAPELLARPGVGPITAAAVLIAWSRPRPPPLRSRVRKARRHSTNPRQLRQNRPPSPRPRRRPPTQGTPHDHPHPPTHRPRHKGIHRSPRLRREERARSDPLPQTLPRPLPLPTTGGNTDPELTNIEASPDPRRRERNSRWPIPLRCDGHACLLGEATAATSPASPYERGIVNWKTGLRAVPCAACA